MLFLFCTVHLDEKHKEIVRSRVKERTGEDCMIMEPEFYDVRSFHVKKEEAAPLHKRLLHWFRM